MVLGGYDSNVIEPGEYHEYTPVTLTTGFYVVEVRALPEERSEAHSNESSAVRELSDGLSDLRSE